MRLYEVVELTFYNEGKTKKASINYIELITQEVSPDCIDVKNHNATFKNGGNLMNRFP